MSKKIEVNIREYQPSDYNSVCSIYYNGCVEMFWWKSILKLSFYPTDRGAKKAVGVVPHLVSQFSLTFAGKGNTRSACIEIAKTNSNT